VSTVCSATLLGGLVDLDVLNDQVAGIKALGICVCLGVLEETKKELSRLDWPSGAGNTELFAYNSINIVNSLLLPSVCFHTLCGTSSSTSVSSHWDGLLVLLDILKELDGSLELPSVDSLCGFTSVLERDT
jgi:hypothetical protein